MIIKSCVVVLIATGIFSLVAVQSVEGDACNSTDTNSSASDDDHEASSGVSSYAGIFIALFANAFNGAGMSLQKVGHNRVAAKAGGHDRVDMDSTAHFKELLAVRYSTPLLRLRTLEQARASTLSLTITL